MIGLKHRERSIVHYSFLASSTSYEEANYVVVGVPYDSTSSWGVGARFGPLSIIEASEYLDPFDLELNCIPLEAGIYTIPEISTLELTPENMVKLVEEVVAEIKEDSKVPILLGGEHTISLGGISALKDEMDALIVLDAHADFYDSYGGRKISHATVSKRASEVVRQVIIYGVRTLGWEEKHEIDNTKNVKIIKRIKNRTDKSNILEILDSIEGKKVYLSVDIDVLDPPQVPCVSTPEPGGLTYAELIELMGNIMRKTEVIGMDFVEFSPCPGIRSDAYLVAKLIYKAIGYHISYIRKDELGCNPNR